MVITIFGDVHGNLIALEKLFKIEKDSTDLFVCHGDVVNYGPWTNECLLFLESLSNCKILKGNHENYYIDREYNGSNVVAKTFFETCIEKFDQKYLTIINGYEDKLTFGDYTIQHTINEGYIYADTPFKNDFIETNFVIGHSHQQYYRNVGDKVLCNTGSLGQNRQYINQSCYLQLDTETGKITLKSFLHDIDKVINQMKVEKYPKICLDYYRNKQIVLS